MPSASHTLARLRHHALAVCGLRSGPLPRSAMLRSGCSVGFGFVVLLTLGRPEAAILCAFFTNFLALADRAKDLRTRLAVQALGGVLFAGLGACGLALSHHLVATMAVVFVSATAAGFAHGTAPGLEALPRFGLCCLVVPAFLPLDPGQGFEAAVFGTATALVTVLLDFAVRRGRRGAYIAAVNANAGRPGPRFSVIYGAAAAAGLLVGVLWGGLRPYWVTITTLLVMQPDRRANTVRVAQRMLGTLAGVVFAFAAVRAIPQPARSGGLLGLVLALPFLWPLGFERNYGLGTAVLSAWVLILIDTALPSADLVAELFLARLSDTAIGCAVALAGSFAFFEVRRSESAAES